MAITQLDLAARIRGAREACRLTQEDVAQYLEVSRPTVAQIEAANRAVSGLELDRLAHLFGRDIRDFFVDKFETEDALTAVFRAQPDVLDQPSVVDGLRNCTALARELTNLEQLLDIDRGQVSVAAYAFPPPETRWDAIQQGNRLAAEERSRLDLGNGPLPALAELLEMQGVRSGLVDLPDDVSGLTLNDARVGHFVVANRAHHYLRRRFSLAHEYCHLLVDRERIGVVSLSSERDNLLEVRANAFAASFLMPEDGVRHFVARLGKGRPSRTYAEVYDGSGTVNVEGRAAPGSQTVQLYDVVQLAHYFEVSRSSSLYRLRNLRLITEAEFNQLKAADDAGKGKQVADFLGLPEPDHTDLRNKFHHRFLGLALEAFRREQISRGKLLELAQMVGATNDELEQALDNPSQPTGGAT
jgi:Zn-dependent peptidase ImmA (M78 family)/DNA-binding XRE family transcriptional regulator